MANKKRWRFKGDRPNRVLEIGEVYEFNPRFEENGEVSVKIAGSPYFRRVTLGYPTQEKFYRDWEEA